MQWQVPEPLPLSLGLPSIADEFHGGLVRGSPSSRVPRKKSHARLYAACDLAVLAPLIFTERDLRSPKVRRQRNQRCY
jgi:hypothetical protein